ncbi:MAG: hydrogenase expression/formation protein HypE [Candidatus Saliniplasma sp.]
MKDDKDQMITMAHGAGGELMGDLIHDLIIPILKSDVGEIPLSDLDDSAVIDDIVITTDGHTVKPIFYPGGDLGSISIAGTVNDLLALGAKPLALTGAVILPEGVLIKDIKTILSSAAETCRKAGVSIVAGDTKVVEREDLDSPLMTTTGIGKRHPLMDKNMERAGERKTKWLSDNNLKEGDKIIVTGTVGDHGITILSEREGYGFQGEIKSDVAPLVDVMDEALNVGGVATVKDPTRGGIANSLNELASKSGVGIVIQEKDIPIKEWVRNAGELLGIDPLTIGNEGKFIMAVEPSMAEKVVEAIKKTENGNDAAIIGEVRSDVEGVVLKTEVGGTRILEPPVGDPVPRIC